LKTKIFVFKKAIALLYVILVS